MGRGGEGRAGVGRAGAPPRPAGAPGSASLGDYLVREVLGLRPQQDSGHKVTEEAPAPPVRDSPGRCLAETLAN